MNKHMYKLFDERADRSQDTDCWIWRGWKAASGSGGLTIPAGKSETGKSHSMSAHVAAWEIYNGPVPAGRSVKRSCGNKLCVNPAHLELRPSNKRPRPKRLKGHTAIEHDNQSCVADPFGAPPELLKGSDYTKEKHHEEA